MKIEDNHINSNTLSPMYLKKNFHLKKILIQKMIKCKLTKD